MSSTAQTLLFVLATAATVLLHAGICSAALSSYEACSGGAPGEQCATISSKWDWSNTASPSNVTLSVSVTVPGGGAKVTDAIVIPNRGCMFTNPATKTFWANFFGKNPKNLAIFSLDMRGSGRSRPAFSCPDDPTGSYIPSEYCASQLAGTAPYYTIEQMANDLSLLLSVLELPDGKVPKFWLVGDGLLGTAVIQRFQKLYPNSIKSRVEGVALTSFTAQEVYDFFEAMTLNPDIVARRVLDQCNLNQDCSNALATGRDTVQMLSRMMLAAQEGTLACNAQLAKKIGASAPTDWPAFYSSMFAHLVSTPALDPFSPPADRQLLSFVPPLLYRIIRCNADDVTAIVAVHTAIVAANANITTPPAYTAKGCYPSQPLLYNVLFSEFVKTAPPPAEVLLKNAKRVTMVQPPATYITAIRSLYDVWPKYSVAAAKQTGYRPTVTTLLLSGEMDVMTRFQQVNYALENDYNGGHTTTMLLPQVPYASLYSAATVATAGTSCTMVNVVQNLVLGSAPSDCYQIGSSDFVPLDFTGINSATAALRTQYFGESNSWGWTAGALHIPTAPPSTAVPPTPVPTTTTGAPATNPPPTPTLVPGHTAQPSTAHPPTPAPPVTTPKPSESDSSSGTIIYVTDTSHDKALYIAIGVISAILILLLGVMVRCGCSRNKVENRDFYAGMYGSVS